MLHPSRRRAEDLDRLLSAAVRPGAEFIVEKRSNNHYWHTKKGDRSCMIVCLDSHRDQDEADEPNEAVYDIVCERIVDRVAHYVTAGRSSSQSEIIAAVVCWMEGQTMEALYERFPFIGEESRLFASIEEEILRYSPELADETTRSRKDGYAFMGGCQLWFQTPTRSCRIFQPGHRYAMEEPGCEFTWNESSILFSFPISDLNQTAQVLKRWLCDNAMPSQLRVEFPWLTIGAVADAYEAGRPVEGEFLASWDDVEKHYLGMRPSGNPCYDLPAAEIQAFVADIRRAGYDRTLRGGPSHYDLVVSRSLTHGLRDDQPRIRFVFRNEGMVAYPNRELLGIRFPEIKFTPVVAELLSQLEVQEIN